MPSILFDEAKAYLELGFRPIPIINDRGTKRPAVEFKELKTHGPYDSAFSDLFKDRECDAIATIVNPEEIVIDIDSNHEAWKDLLELETPILGTCDGWHLHFNRPASLKMSGESKNLHNGLEIKASGSLTAIHGMHPDGVKYNWIKHPKETPAADMPGYLIDLLNTALEDQGRDGKKLSEHEIARLLRGLSEGEGRNNACMILGGHYIGKGLAWAEIKTILIDWNNKNRPPMEDQELEGCLKSLQKMKEQKQEKEEIKEISTEELNAIVDREQTLKLNLSLSDDHFISKFTNWMSSVTDAFYEYQVAGALWLLSACVEGRLCLRLKQETVYPNLWINCIGKSTTSRKTTAVNKAKKTYETIADLTLYNDDYSLEGYLESLSKNPVQHFVRDEAAGLLAKMHKQYNEGIFEAECAIYDGQSYKKTLSSGKAKAPRVFEVKNPYVTHLYATTPDNYSMIMTLMDFLCGYGFRFLFCCPNYKREKMDLELATQEDIDSWASVITTIKRLRHQIQSNNIREFTATAEAMALYNNMLRALEEVCESQDNEMLNAAIGRNQIHILKIAMLLEIGKEEPSFCITQDTIITSFNMVVSFFLPSLFDVINRLQTDLKNNQVERVIASLRNLGGKANRSKLLQNTHLKSKDFKECVDTLLESEVIKQVQEKGKKSVTYILMDTHDISTILTKVSSFSNFSSLSMLAESTESMAKMAKIESEARNINNITPRARDEVHVSYANGLKPLKLLNVLNLEFFKRISQEWQALNKTSVNSSNLDKFMIYAQMRHTEAHIDVTKEDLEAYAMRYFKIAPEIPETEVIVHTLESGSAAIKKMLGQEV